MDVHKLVIDLYKLAVSIHQLTSILRLSVDTVVRLIEIDRLEIGPIFKPSIYFFKLVRDITIS